ncbi:molybdopterin molybdenumtransferase MoeA, partial [Pseudomonas syringae pv. tagetis]
MAFFEATQLFDRQRVPLAVAEGRVFAVDLLSTLDLPPWRNSAMDCYALRVADWSG